MRFVSADDPHCDGMMALSFIWYKNMIALGKIANLLAAARFSAVDLLQSVSCSQLLQWLTSHGG